VVRRSQRSALPQLLSPQGTALLLQQRVRFQGMVLLQQLLPPSRLSALLAAATNEAASTAVPLQVQEQQQ
jgi:hypothetical protein